MILPDEDVLAMMADVARHEQMDGQDGWCRPPDHLREACGRLVDRALAMCQDKIWFMPTEAGFAMAERGGRA